MITIATKELVGMLADVLPFASVDDEDGTLYRVNISFDGARLHATTADGYRAAWCSWGPDDDGEFGDQPQLGVHFGSDGDGMLTGEDAWVVRAYPSDVADLIKTFRLPTKEGMSPLTVDGVDGRSLRVGRNADTGYPAHSMSIVDRAGTPPPIMSLINDMVLENNLGSDRVADGHSTPVVRYSGSYLADFCSRVRQRGPVILNLGRKATVVSIGDHFTGMIMQVGEATHPGNPAGRDPATTPPA